MSIKSTLIKIIAAGCAIMVILGLISVAAGWIDWTLFWVIIIFGAIMAYFVVPWLKKKSEKV